MITGYLPDNRFISTLIIFLLLLSTHSAALSDGGWNQISDLRGSSRDGAVGFTIGSRGYIGTGYDGSWRSDFWEYNPNSDTWRQRAVFGGGGRRGAAGFSVGNRGYIGTGYNGSWRKDFWEYNPSSNTWTQKADFAGRARESAVGFSIGNKGYLGTGWEGENLEDFWEYNPANNSWTQKADFAGTARSAAVGFSIDNKGYIGTGYDGEWRRDFWEYDPSSNTWTRRADLGGTARLGAVGFSIDGKGYIGTGLDVNWSGEKRDLWEYDPSSNTWRQRTEFGGVSRFAAVGFSIGDKGYIGTGWVGATLDDVWEYDPSKEPPDEVDLIVVSPDNQDYGVVIEGKSSKRSFIIENPNTHITITGSLTLTGAASEQYKVVDGDQYFNLGPGETKQVTVEFKPLSPGIKDATFQIEPSLDNLSSSIDVSLSGTGIQVDFATILSVTDKNDNIIPLIFGTTNAEFTLNPDQYPKPDLPPDSFDARFHFDGNEYLKDLRSPTETQTLWTLIVQSSSGGYPITLNWDPAQLHTDGRFRLVDDPEGNKNISINMRTTDTFTIGDPEIKELYIIHSILESQNVQNRSGWNLVGLPLETASQNYKTLFPHAITGTLYHFDGVYQQSESLEISRGYWLRFPDDGIAILQGKYVDQVEIQLAPGWNIISGVSDKTSVAAIDDPDNILIPGTVYGFDGIYYQASELLPGKGYWIRASSSGNIRITGGDDTHQVTAKIVGGTGQRDYLSKFNQLVFTADDDAEQVLYFGHNFDDEIDPAQYSMPPTAPSVGLDVRFSTDRYVEEGNEVLINVQSDYGTTEVEFLPSMEQQTNEYMLYELSDDGTKLREIILNGRTEIILSGSNVGAIQILPYDQVRGSVPDEFNLSQNYPNPFNPSTNITYGLPVDANVKLEVFNVLGQRVDILVDEFQEAGYYEVTFHSGSLPSGTYLYRIQADNFVDVKRFMLLK